MEIGFDTLAEASSILYWRAVTRLPPDVTSAIRGALDSETDEGARLILESMLENSELAVSRSLPICQDGGIPVFFIEMPVDCTFEGNPLTAIADGIEDATRTHHLRPNCVDPLTRKNTGNNRGNRYPVVHFTYTSSESVRITLLAKGSGSESRSAVRMVNPVEGLTGVRNFILETVAKGAALSCPPVVVGVGIGGSFESVAGLSKLALTRPLNKPNSRADLAELEASLLEDINSLGIGPMGLGGRTTALSVLIELGDTHITCLPVAVNMSCWAHRRAVALVDEDGFRVVD